MAGAKYTGAGELNEELNYITVAAHNAEVDSLLDTIEKLGMLAVERKKEIELLNARIVLLESQLEELQEEQK